MQRIDFFIIRCDGCGADTPGLFLFQKEKQMLLSWIDAAPRRVLALVCVGCLGLLGFALYLQLAGGLEPCPMCIVQRYALILVAVFAGLAALSKRKGTFVSFGVVALLFAGFGAFTAARQSFLQWYPPEIATCGRDLYGMIETFPLKRALPLIFRGGGDCSAVDWTFLGGSIANWSFVCFAALIITLLLTLARRLRQR
jgi:disulfide bond formation protein DsbB